MKLIAAFLLAHTGAYVLFVLSWVVLGGGALSGRVDGGDFVIWAALLAGSVPCHLAATRLQSSISLRLGGLLRQRLVRGTLGLDRDELRGQGVGRLLGRVLEVEAVESLAVGGGLLGLVACVELVIAGVALGAASVPALAILVAWVGITLVVARRYLRARQAWTESRLELTDDIVAKMLGHRTRLAQQSPADWHVGEDDLLRRYENRSRQLDRRLVVLSAVCTRGWVVIGVTGLWISATDVAVGIGGVALAAGALRSLTAGLGDIADASTAWANLKPLTRPISYPISEVVSVADDGPLLDAESVTFRPALDGVNLRVGTGERLLVTGNSGSGKSTLVSLLAGLRMPHHGTIRLHGRSLQDIGEHEWRRRVVLSPQFHENHLMLGSLAFNLLVGRGWPATADDLDDAQAVCEQLGLGPLLNRMPSGLHQIVGETGWQLSHGERSLVFLARALLQNPDVLVLDETLGALDPATQHQVVTVLDKIEPAVVLVHHGNSGSRGTV
ncbi:ABC transporter ATP-binding protein/permease [Kibdelosporangium philippinense]|uniref:ABC transporter ATP-binding protein/permease n=1 Tax=Kibdelosporangium philippinense TaxID=211113 RepID=A0ABS8ZSI5_9PSEU|nr:ABC transporter ATP-binding protein [Kibdelosporangium philippinense]MCE7010679.1 ABC transporter ATP-binding protein/permease [Kibdelosporangium philippinense]